jgi:hypothetical protein
MESNSRRIVVALKDRDIPRTKDGDPAFEKLEELQKVFSPEEIVALVNRQIYQMEYQRNVHRDRAREEREKLAPLKKKVKEMFGVSFIKATDKQLDEALAKLKEEQGA